MSEATTRTRKHEGAGEKQYTHQLNVGADHRNDSRELETVTPNCRGNADASQRLDFVRKPYSSRD
jgi:hypothetical protein